MINRGYFFLQMILSKKIQLLPIFLLIIIFIFLFIKSNQYWTNSRFLPIPTKYVCSFDNINACQISNMTKRTFVYIMWGGAGFGSELNQLILAFAYSVSTKRQFLVDSQGWNYGNFFDYFNVPSMKYYYQFNRTFLVENSHQNDKIDHLKTTRIGGQVRHFWLATQHLQSIEIKRRVAHYLWKSISNQTFEFIQKCKLKNVSNYIGIHIRKGDKLKKEAHEISLNKYINITQRLLIKNKNIEKIFVASDDRLVIQQLRKLKPKWNFINIDRKLNRTGHFQSNFNQLSEKEKLNETRLFLCELQMLIDADYVLCGMSSNVCRLVQILRYQHPSTMISLDRSWYGT